MTAETRNKRARKRADADADGIILEADPAAIADHLAAVWPPALPAGDRDLGDALARYGKPPADALTRAQPVNFLATVYGRRFLVIASAGENADDDDSEHAAVKRAHWFAEADYWAPDADALPAVLAMRALDNAQTLAAWEVAARSIKAATTDVERARTTHALDALGDPDEHTAALVARLARLPETPDSTSGLSLLTVVVETVPEPVEADRHPRAILPASLRDATRDYETLPLALDRITPLGPIREPEQSYLPTLAPPPSLVPPVPWLTLYDLTATGPMQTRGRGAPLAQRLFVEVLTAVPRDGREWTAAPPVTLRDLFEWLWPRYWDPEKWNKRTRAWGDWSGGYQRNKHLEPLRRALIELDNMRIEYDRLERRLIRVDDLPTAATALDERIRFHVRHLPASDHGPAFDRARARRWGVASAPAWRSTIRLAYLWDEAKGRNHGARVYATRPVVARVAGPGSPLLGPDGKPLRNRRGAGVTDWSDRRAVILGTDGKPAGADNPPAFERNPAADRVPVLGPDDLTRLGYDSNMDLPAGTRRKRLHETREALRDKETVGEVVIEVDGDGWRIIENRPTTR